MRPDTIPLMQQACFIDGEWVSADSKKTFDVVNPFDGSRLGSVPECGRAETERAILAANYAFQEWKTKTAKERSDLLWTYAHLIDQHKQDLAQLMTLEQGKPLAESLTEIDYANRFIKWFAEEGRRVYGDIIPSNIAGQHLLTIKQPIGVVAAITPWNFPSAMMTRKIAPALAAGCTVVVKPDEATPFSALALAKLAEMAGLPKGVLNVVTGIPEEIGSVMTSHPLVRKLSFTGSTAVGSKLMAACATSIKKITLELGGNAPFIVFDDADLDAAVTGAIASKFRNSGQTCVCANRLMVHADVHNEFIRRFVDKVKQLKVGNGLDPEVQQGPLINEAAVKKVEHHIQDAVSKGAVIMTGGKRIASSLMFEPTVLTHVESTMVITQEETFGPVAPIMTFTDDQQLIQMANDTTAGLAAYFYSRDLTRIWRIAEALDYGMVGVNTGMVSTEVAPFGGVKQSGIGREGSKYGIEPYLEIKYICMG